MIRRQGLQLQHIDPRLPEIILLEIGLHTGNLVDDLCRKLRLSRHHRRDRCRGRLRARAKPEDREAGRDQHDGAAGTRDDGLLADRHSRVG
jgi:hypothetical protein